MAFATGGQELRKLLAFIALAALAVTLWYGSRWLTRREEIQLTLMFDSAAGLRSGSSLVSKGRAIGKVTSVTRLERQDAVSIVVRNEDRQELHTDSLFAVEGGEGEPRLEVVNTLAVGPPPRDGDVIVVHEDKLKRWLARHAAGVGPLVDGLERKSAKAWDQLDSSSLDRQLDEWKARLPEWKSEGSVKMERNLDAAKRRFASAEDELRRLGKGIEADRLRQKFDGWMAQIEKAPPARAPE